MIKQGRGGAITIVSSPHANIPFPTAMAYNMAKAAIDHMGRTAAIELIQHDIRVNVFILVGLTLQENANFSVNNNWLRAQDHCPRSDSVPQKKWLTGFVSL